MCGIVGVTGRADACDVLVEGLRRLEYRGYDSAGVCVAGADGALAGERAAGKVSALAGKLAARGGLTGASGIAHTRWATHGAAEERNAHPHRAGQVSLVHNGIIENHAALKAELVRAGRTFQSDTDSEVVAHLFDQALDAHADPHDAWRSVVARLQGAFALAAVSESAPGLVFGARRAAPLLAALGQQTGYIASDAMALPEDARTLIYLEDGDTVVVSAGQADVRDAQGRPAQRKQAAGPGVFGRVDKGPFRHFMEKEIHEQPEVVGRTLAAYLNLAEGAVQLPSHVDFKAMNRLLIVGCGTAAYAGMVARYSFESLAGLPCEVDIASEFRYRDPAFAPGDAALFISQSGETADTLEALRLCQQAGLITIALTNTPHSTMAREADIVLPTLAGPEIGVASTKAFTCQLAALFALAIAAGAQRGRLDKAGVSAAIADLSAAPRLMGEALNLRQGVDALALDLARSDIVLFLGRNALFPLALEGALKLKEISYIHAEGYAAGELKHGPIALIEEGVAVIVLAPMDALFDKTRSSIEQVRARGARVIAVADEAAAAALDGQAALTLVTPPAGRLSAPIVMAVAVQLIAYLTAVHKGTDVDQPRNLAKSVTVE
ncbi:glutamine--fructose-6-phosphate transaminase (isomerizing) [Alkalicaulis satelles]|uniref:Glutamine--fructose-6-phosphate aminotransferase [isomerizing] n=1 Tax=Alkalicaulis satelles TaxID=2609175 RepID=A0A5M6ZK87_9PROT|nr:glutamine--fructose-6-phosphate transaminase (isomerizing) [Alkalicaulis satelles]KAA5803638.1 glutamine--fructose-6-phosphate transaminase (isomerizing) [Alkalicaulis satelles]